MMIFRVTLLVCFISLCRNGIEAKDLQDKVVRKDSGGGGKKDDDHSLMKRNNLLIDSSKNLPENNQYSRLGNQDLGHSKPLRLEDFEQQDENDQKDNDEEGRRYIVKYKKYRAKTSSGVISKQNIELLGKVKVQSLNRSNADVVMLKSEAELFQLQNDENVEYVERDYKYFMTMAGPDTSTVSTFINKETTPYGIDMVKAQLVNATKISNRKVCIIDSGYDKGHSDLQTDGVDGSVLDDELPWDEDTNGHGTHVLGTIAALGNNKWGVTGVIPNGQLRIFIVRVFGSDDYWVWGSDLSHAMYECADADANIINMSLGASSYSAFFEDSCKDINENRNVLLVASAGNSGYSYYNYPAAYDNVISVAAIDNSTTRAYFSNYNDKVDIAAPGVDVLSTVPRPFGSFDLKSGTSMAAPHVSGVAALVWSHFPSISARQLQIVLESTATDLGPFGRDNYYGHGLVNAKAAYDFLSDGNTFSPTFSPTGLECAEGKKKFDLKITPDSYGYTTAWELREACNGQLKLDGGEEGKVFCIADANYVFIIRDSWGSGLCCNYGRGGYELYFDNVLIHSGGEFDDEESISFGNSTNSCNPTQSPTPKGPTPAPTGVQCEYGMKKFDLTLVPDSDYYHSSWKLTNTCTGETVLDGSDKGIVACVDDLQYDFSISEYNGLCCSYGMGYYEVYFDELFIKSGGDFDGEESVTFSTSTAESCSPTSSPTAVVCAEGRKKFDLKLTPDNGAYSYQTSWKLKQACSGDTILEGGAHGITSCLDDIEYHFTIYDYNGLCCGYGEGWYEIYYDQSFIKAGGDFNGQESVKFGSSLAESCAPTMAPTGTLCPYGTQKFILKLTPDSYPYRSQWSLIDYSSGSIIQSGDGNDESVVICIDDSSMYEFTMAYSSYYGSFNGEYKIYYNGSLLRTGTGIYSQYQEVTAFGSADENLRLGFVGVSAKLTNSTKSAFKFQTKIFLEDMTRAKALSMRSLGISIVSSIVVVNDCWGFTGDCNDVGLIVYMEITARVNSFDEYQSSRSGKGLFSTIFEESWSEFEMLVMPILLSDDLGDANYDDSTSDDHKDNKSLLTIFITISIVGALLTLCFLAVLIKMCSNITGLKQVAAITNIDDNENKDTFDNNVRLDANQEEKATFESNVGRDIEEEKVEEGDIANAVSNSAVAAPVFYNHGVGMQLGNDGYPIEIENVKEENVKKSETEKKATFEKNVRRDIKEEKVGEDDIENAVTNSAVAIRASNTHGVDMQLGNDGCPIERGTMLSPDKE